MSQQYPQDPNQPQQPGQPQYPGQPPYQPPMPPPPGYVLKKKKTHKFRNFVVLPFVGLIALIVIISAAGGGGSSTDAGTASGGRTKTTAPAAPEDRGQPRPVTIGKAFTIGKHRFDAGWKMQYQQYIGTQLVGSVTNVSKDTSTAFFHVKFLKGNSVLANFQCSTNDLEPGQTEQVECYNSVTTTQRVTGWDKVTAEATF